METAVEPVVTEAAAFDLEALVVEHKRMVYRIAYSVLRNHHDAEDTAQETFVKAWKAAARLPASADRKAWLARIAWNASIDRARARKSGGQDDAVELAGVVERTHAAGHNAEQIASGAEMQRLLDTLIAGLPPRLREVLVLSTVEELEHEEIAQVLKIDRAAVRMRLFQARQLLREKLERLLQRP